MTRQTIPRPSANNVFLAIILALLAIGAAGCTEFDFDFSGACETRCPVYPSASPNFVRILKGDTVRIAACVDSEKCAPALNSGNALAHWMLLDTTVATFVGSPVPTVVESATSVLVRGRALGNASVAVDFEVGGMNRSSLIEVVDSATVKLIDLISYSQQSNQLHVGTHMSFTARLKDEKGYVVRAWPTDMSVSDSRILELQVTTDLDGGARMSVRGLQQGTAVLTITFLGVSRELTLTVLP